MNEESLIACFACAMFSFRLLRTVLVSQGVKLSRLAVPVSSESCSREKNGNERAHQIRMRSFGTRESSNHGLLTVTRL